MVTTIQEVQIGRVLQNQGFSGVMKIPTDTFETIGFNSISEAYVYSNGYGFVDPTDQQMIEWQTESDSILQLEGEVKAEIDSYPVNPLTTKLSLEILGQVIKVYSLGLNHDVTTIYQNFLSKLAGSIMEDEIKNYVTMQTGLTGFGTGIPDVEKRQILTSTTVYLLSLSIVRLAQTIG